MEKFNRFLLNTLCVLIFASTFFVLGLFNTGSKLADIYRQNEPEEVVKHDGDPYEYEIMDKKNDGDYLEFVIWDVNKEKTNTIKVNPDDYDLYKIGEQYYTDKNTIKTLEDVRKEEGLSK